MKNPNLIIITNELQQYQSAFVLIEKYVSTHVITVDLETFFSKDFAEEQSKMKPAMVFVAIDNDFHQEVSAQLDEQLKFLNQQMLVAKGEKEGNSEIQMLKVRRQTSTQND